MECDDRTVFVGNLGPDVTEAVLRELFLVAGPIERIRWQIVGGIRKTFAHIIFRYESSVSYAMEVFRGTMLYRRELSVQLASNNSQRDSGQGRFGSSHDNFRSGRYENPPHENNHRDGGRYNNPPRDYHRDARKDNSARNFHHNRRNERSGYDNHHREGRRRRDQREPYPSSNYRN